MSGNKLKVETLTNKSTRICQITANNDRDRSKNGGHSCQIL